MFDLQVFLILSFYFQLDFKPHPKPRTALTISLKVFLRQASCSLLLWISEGKNRGSFFIEDYRPNLFSSISRQSPSSWPDLA